MPKNSASLISNFNCQTTLTISNSSSNLTARASRPRWVPFSDIHEFINRSELEDTICKVVDIISDVPRLPRFEYIEHIQPIEPSKLVRRDKSVILSRRVSASLRDIYKILPDFYSVNELESFRTEYGDQILRQIYNDEMDYFYHC